MINKQNKKKMYIIRLVIFIAVIVLLRFFVYQLILSEKTSQAMFTSLMTKTSEQKTNFESQILSDQKIIATLATTMSSFTMHFEEMDEYFESVKVETNFQSIEYIGEEKWQKFKNQEGVLVQALQLDGYDNTLIVSHHKAFHLELVTPVFDKDNRIKGYLMGYYSKKNLEDIFISLDEKGSELIVDQEGNVLMMLNQKNEASQFLIDNIDTWLSPENDKAQNIKWHHKSESVGELSWDYQDNQYLMSYQTLDFNNWSIYSFSTEEVLLQDVETEFYDGYIVYILIGMGVLGVIGFGLWKKRREQQIVHEHKRELSWVTYHDHLTGLPNLAELKQKSEATINQNSTVCFAFIKIDLLQFKMINEMYGYIKGDEVLHTIGKVWSSFCTNYGIVSRINSDNFIVFDTKLNIEKMLEKHDDIEAQIIQETGLVYQHIFHFRYGVYDILNDESNIDEMIEKVNFAHSFTRVTAQKICRYDKTIRDKIIFETQLENDMEKAISNNDFKIFLQPKYDLQNQSIIGAEALVRWKYNGKLLTPNTFIPLFERNGFIKELDSFVYEQVCEILSSWIAKGYQCVPISINFSKVSLLKENFVEELDMISHKWKVPKEFLELEILESGSLHHINLFAEQIDAIHQSGFLISMDDFGTEYSSLSMLKNLPLDIIKLDRSFFDVDMYNPRANVVIESIIEMAHRLSMTVVAEGVETSEQVEFLRVVGCDIAQGFFYSKPIELEKFEEVNFYETDM